MDASLLIRRACNSDLDALTELERIVWEPLGVPALARTEMAQWLEEDSPFFLVAEQNGKVCGSYFGRLIQLTLPRALEFLSSNNATGKGYSRYPHTPLGNSLYGINIISSASGAGRALYERVHVLEEEMNLRYSIGFVRLTGLVSFMAGVTKPFMHEDTYALWYAHESARMLGLRTWDVCPKQPEIQNVRLTTPDPMLAFHTKGTRFGLLGILPNYMPDPASCNYGALILSEFPHR